MPSHGGMRHRVCPLASAHQDTGLKAVVKVLLPNTGLYIVLFFYQNKEFGMEDILGLVRSYYRAHPQPSEREVAFVNFAIPLQQRAVT